MTRSLYPLQEQRERLVDGAAQVLAIDRVVGVIGRNPPHASDLRNF